MFNVENFEKDMKLKGSFEIKSKNSIEVDGHRISSHILVEKVKDGYYLTRYTEDDESGKKFYVDRHTYHITNGRTKNIPLVKDSTDDYIPFPGYFSDEAIILSWQIARYLTNTTSRMLCSL